MTALDVRDKKTRLHDDVHAQIVQEVDVFLPFNLAKHDELIRPRAANRCRRGACGRACMREQTQQ
jgi:hypothetical protein